MNRYRLVTLMRLIVILAAVACGIHLGRAQINKASSSAKQPPAPMKMRSVTRAQREAAAKRRTKKNRRLSKRFAGIDHNRAGRLHSPFSLSADPAGGSGAGPHAVRGGQMTMLAAAPAAPMAMLTPGAPPDYFNVANFANSPLPTLTGPGPVNAITVGSGGTGYTAPTVTIADVLPGTGSGAIATATADATTAPSQAYTLTAGGSGYTNPLVIITDTPPGTGSGAAATATVDPGTGAITGITVTNPGTGYTAPTVAFVDTMPGPGTGATATATSTDGVITAITVTNGGSGYIAPAVSITDPSPSSLRRDGYSVHSCHSRRRHPQIRRLPAGAEFSKQSRADDPGRAFRTR